MTSALAIGVSLATWTLIRPAAQARPMHAVRPLWRTSRHPSWVTLRKEIAACPGTQRPPNYPESEAPNERGSTRERDAFNPLVGDTGRMAQSTMPQE
ncbi:MAG: hypothetical protein AB7V46_19340 [Thermomicrobiales bacterium]